MTKSLAAIAAFAAAGTLAFSAQAASPTAKVGLLTCDVSPGWGLVVTSHRALDCTFTEEGRVESYEGHITTLGVDVGRHDAAKIAWAVLAPARLDEGALAGDYGGVGGAASAGVGGGANVLLGGSDQSVSLQPVSLEGETGVAVSAGVTGINLVYRR